MSCYIIHPISIFIYDFVNNSILHQVSYMLNDISLFGIVYIALSRCYFYMYLHKTQVSTAQSHWLNALQNQAQGIQFTLPTVNYDNNQYNRIKKLLLLSFCITIFICDIIPLLIFNIDSNYNSYDLFVRSSRVFFLLLTVISFILIFKQINPISDTHYFSMEIKAMTIFIFSTFVLVTISLIIDLSISSNNGETVDLFFLFETITFMICDFMLIYATTGHVYYKYVDIQGRTAAYGATRNFDNNWIDSCCFNHGKKNNNNSGIDDRMRRYSDDDDIDSMPRLNGQLELDFEGSMYDDYDGDDNNNNAQNGWRYYYEAIRNYPRYLSFNNDVEPYFTHKDAFAALAEHLTKEFSTENLLFLLEATKYRAKIYQFLYLSRKWGLNCKLWDNANEITMIKDHSKIAMKKLQRVDRLTYIVYKYENQLPETPMIELESAMNGAFTWDMERIIWIAFYKNINNNEKNGNLFATLPKDIIKHLLKFLDNHSIVIEHRIWYLLNYICKKYIDGGRAPLEINISNSSRRNIAIKLEKFKKEIGLSMENENKNENNSDINVGKKEDMMADEDNDNDKADFICIFDDCIAEMIVLTKDSLRRFQSTQDCQRMIRRLQNGDNNGNNFSSQTENAMRRHSWDRDRNASVSKEETLESLANDPRKFYQQILKPTRRVIKRNVNIELTSTV